MTFGVISCVLKIKICKYIYNMSSLLINYILIFLVIVVIGFFYNKYEEKQNKMTIEEDYNAIQKYLLNDNELSSLGNSKKPILWIHIKYEYNARNWLSWGSRSSFCLNQPYLYLTVKSIIEKCGNSFQICIIDDESFGKLLPEWSINMSTISNPILSNMRTLGLMRILYKYGGFILPPSFICFKDLIDFYVYNTSNNCFFVGENIDRNVTSTTHDFYPDISFCGASKECPIVEKLIQFITQVSSNDFTAQSVFLGDFDRWVQYHRKYINVIDGKLLGIKTNKYDEPITIEVMFSNNYLDLNENAIGIYVPADEILSRRNYGWFARLSTSQVLECNAIICKYLLLSCFPNGYSVESLSMRENEKMPPYKSKPWVQFWSTPLRNYSKLNVGTNSGLYLVSQPNMLGDNLKTISNNNFLQNVETY